MHLDQSSLNHPRLRAVEAQALVYEGMRYLRLTDPLNLSEKVLLVPEHLIPVLTLLDGTRDIKSLQAVLALRYKLTLGPQHLAEMIAALDESYLLENQRFKQARLEALRAFHSGGFRPPALAGSSYSADPYELQSLFESYLIQEGLHLEAHEIQDGQNGAPLPFEFRGLLSPHIDYERGHAVYARTWAAAAHSAREADLVVIIGTDHHSEGQPLTLTRQNYATPFGVLPTPTGLVDRLAGILGSERAFGGELHHRLEHSIELAAVWLHFVRGGKEVELLPILCGPIEALANDQTPLSKVEVLNEFVGTLQKESRRRKVLVVAAGDLSHVGPAFNGPPANPGRLIALKEDDDRLLDFIQAGQAESFFSENQSTCSNNNVCGTSPIYLTLRILGKSRGQPLGYAVCPADPDNTSVVTIAGVGLI